MNESANYRVLGLQVGGSLLACVMWKMQFPSECALTDT